MGSEEAGLHRRIRELERELESLREQAARYKNLYVNSPDIIYYLDKTGKFTRINDDAFDPLGYPNGDIRLENYVSEVVHPEDQQRVIKHFYDSVAARVRDVRGLTFRVRKSNGEILWVELYSRMNYDEKGEFFEEVGFLRDVTQRRKMEEKLINLNRELADANEKLQAAYRWMRESHDILKSYRYEDDIGFLLDGGGRIEWTSEGALILTGKARTALIGSCLTELIPEDCLEPCRTAMNQAWRGITTLSPIRLRTEGDALVAMEMKMTRLTSLETRRLWVLLQRPIQSA